MSATLATVRSAPGLERYLETLELRLEQAVGAEGSWVGSIAAETLSAGGKRLRPLLVFLSALRHERQSERTLASGVAVELVHMATLVHDDLLDGADLRRGQPTVWAAHGARTAKTVGDYLYARAFGELADSGDAETVFILAGASLALARGEALQRRQAFRPDTSVEQYLQRCALKTGKLFEAACLLGGGRPQLGAFGLALGIAFQIADDILDCTGDQHATGKEGGVDLRDGTPTLPLILAAQRDPEVWQTLAGDLDPLGGGPSVEQVLERVALTGALEASRSLALEYACRARAALDGEPDRAALEALTHAVVDREA